MLHIELDSLGDKIFVLRYHEDVLWSFDFGLKQVTSLQEQNPSII